MLFTFFFSYKRRLDVLRFHSTFSKATIFGVLQFGLLLEGCDCFSFAFCKNAFALSFERHILFEIEQLLSGFVFFTQFMISSYFEFRSSV